MLRYFIFGNILIISLCHSQILLGQNNFSNQGEQENFWASELFKNSYSKQTFKRFNGKIKELDNNKILFDSTVLKVFIDDLTIKKIFTIGIFYPDIFDDPRTFDPSNKKIKLRSAEVSMENETINTTSTKVNNTEFKDLFHNDTISITNVKEDTFLSNSPKIKRFRMWVYHRWMHNPVVYLFELTNENATINTSKADFINEASLTFVRRGWVIF